MFLFLFYLFAAVAVVSAIIMISHKNPVYSALFLILTMFSIAGFYVLLNAPFIAAVHIVVYAGAVMVLFLFVIMLIDFRKDETEKKKGLLLPFLGILLALVLVVQLGIFLFSGFHNGVESTAMVKVGSTKAIGELLFTKYLFPFEVTSVLLLSAIIGSVLLAKQKLKS